MFVVLSFSKIKWAASLPLVENMHLFGLSFSANRLTKHIVNAYIPDFPSNDYPLNVLLHGTLSALRSAGVLKLLTIRITAFQRILRRWQAMLHDTLKHCMESWNPCKAWKGVAVHCSHLVWRIATFHLLGCGTLEELDLAFVLVREPIEKLVSYLVFFSFIFAWGTDVWWN